MHLNYTKQVYVKLWTCLDHKMQNTVVYCSLYSMLKYSLTSAQSNFTCGSIFAAQGRFNRIRQVPPMHSPSKHCLAPHEFTSKTACISIGSAVFAQLTTVTDRQTDRPRDHATLSVAIGRIYVVLPCGQKRHAFSYLCVLISLQTWRKDCIHYTGPGNFVGSKEAYSREYCQGCVEFVRDSEEINTSFDRKEATVRK